MYDNYRMAVREIEFGEINELENLKKTLGGECKYLETVMFAQSRYIEDKLMITRTRNAIGTHGIQYSVSKITTNLY